MQKSPHKIRTSFLITNAYENNMVNLMFLLLPPLSFLVFMKVQKLHHLVIGCLYSKCLKVRTWKDLMLSLITNHKKIRQRLLGRESQTQGKKELHCNLQKSKTAQAWKYLILTLFDKKTHTVTAFCKDLCAKIFNSLMLFCFM